MSCDHKFVDSLYCLKCGFGMPAPSPPAAPDTCKHDGFSHSKNLTCPAAPELPEGEGVWFCVPCEDANVTRSDADRCCLMCGIDLASLGQLRALLATQGLSIVDAKELAVLDACAAIRLIPNHFTTGDGMSLHDAERIVQAELARREKL